MRLPRYLAIAGPFDPFGMRRTIGEVMAEAGLTPVFSCHALQVYSKGCPSVDLADSAGLVLGPIFRKDGAMATIDAFGDTESRAARDSRGMNLIEQCWGDYVAFLVDGSETTILRPPLSDLGCLRAQHRGVHLIASDVELLTLCGVPTREVNWTEIARHLCTGGLRREATAIAGIDELLWGNRIVLDASGLYTEACWSPWRFALGARRDRAADLAEELREMTLACVKAQVRHLDKVAVMLSGGLDSSILTSCLARSGTETICLNLPFGDANGDERIFARRVASRLALPIFEIAPLLGDVDITWCGTPGLARPITRAFQQATRRAKYRLAAATGVSDIVDGGGGDSLFGSLQSAAPVADRLLREGFSRGMMKTATDIARLTSASLPRVIALALRRAYLRRRAYRWENEVRFLSRNAMALTGKPSHPWLGTPWGALPGSATHIANMIVVENLLEIGNGAVAEWSPLMAQPLVEFCLSVPSWHWLDNGHNRALARHAFADILPPEIAWRRDKGTPDGFVAEIFATNRETLRGFLIGGSLAEAGLLDLEAIDAALTPNGAIKGHDHIHLLRIADVEAWVRSCQAAPGMSQSADTAIQTDHADA